MSNSPVKTLAYPAGTGNQIQLAIWENKQSKEGEEFKSYSVSIQRRYRDGEQWKTATGFRPSGVLVVSHACQQAYDEIRRLQA